MEFFSSKTKHTNTTLTYNYYKYIFLILSYLYKQMDDRMVGIYVSVSEVTGSILPPLRKVRNI